MVGKLFRYFAWVLWTHSTINILYLAILLHGYFMKQMKWPYSMANNIFLILIIALGYTVWWEILFQKGVSDEKA